MVFTFNDAIIALQDLIKMKSVQEPFSEGAPFGLELRKALDFSLDLLEKAGLKTKDVDGYCGWGEIGEGELFGILAHLDVVPEGNDWTYPPYGAEIHEDVLYGRGALDNKAPIIAVIYALNRLLEEGYKPKKRVRIILGCNEESGWKCMDRYSETEEMPVMGFSPDADFPVINAEKGIVYHEIKIKADDDILDFNGGFRANMVPDFASVTIKEKPDIIEKAQSEGFSLKKVGNNIMITAKGVSAHGSHPDQGENAVIKLFKLLAPFYPEFQHLYECFNDYYGGGLGLDIEDEQSGRLTLNLGKVDFLEGFLILSLDIRHPISYNKDEMTTALQKKIQGEVTQGFYHLPLYVDKDNELIVKLLNAYNEVTKEKGKPIAIGGGTYARVLPMGVAFGPMLPDTPNVIHQANEHITLKHFKLLTDIYYKAIKDICF